MGRQTCRTFRNLPPMAPTRVIVTLQHPNQVQRMINRLPELDIVRIGTTWDFSNHDDDVVKAATESLIGAVWQCRNLTHLTLIDKHIDNDAAGDLATALHSLPALTTLELRNNQIGLRGVHSLLSTMKTSMTCLGLQGNAVTLDELRQLVQTVLLDTYMVNGLFQVVPRPPVHWTHEHRFVY